MKRITLPVVTLLFLILFTGCTGGQFVASSGWSGIAIGSDLVYAGARSGRMLALDVRNGDQRAAFPPEGQDPLKGLYGTPALADGVLYVPGYDGRVYALSAADLSQRWRYPSDESKVKPIVGGVVVAGGFLVYGSEDGYVRALQASTGAKVWEFETRNKVWSTPTVAAGVVYAGSLDHNLYALSLQDGDLAWAQPFQADGGIVAAPLVYQGRVYVGSFDRRVYALDAASGREIWRFEGKSWFWGSPVTDGRHVFAVDARGIVHALVIGTGKEQWQFDMKKSAISTPVVVGKNLVVASDGGIVYVLALGSGGLVTTYNVGGQVQAPLVTDGQIVYVNAMDKRVWAIRMGDRQEKVWQISTETKK